MTNNIGKLDQIKSYKGRDKIFVGDDQGLQISYIGNVSLTTRHKNLQLKNVLVILN